ncbi:MAG: hypothetical protein EA418_00425 [Wenzhouxiangellaceae bacterium]|nr:MAG: hypothetical protein EA418_00425 [Wenzhouxiangellaceae bacterium]
MHQQLLSLAAACSLSVSALAAPDYHGEIRPMIEQHCLMCHADDSISFSFADPEFTYNLGPAIVATVRDRRMPPWLAEPGHQQYVDDISLSSAQIETFLAWADGGFPRGEPASRNGAPPALARSFQADLALDVLPGQSYLPRQDRADDYRCFVIDWPLDEPAYVTGFRAAPGNLRVVHHLVLFAVQPQLAERFRELQDAEEGPGYQCFGAAVPDRLGLPEQRQAYEQRYPDGVIELHRGNYWLAHWAPGMEGYSFPSGTGIPMPPGSVLVAQMHYYSVYAPGEADTGSQMEFQVSSLVERPAINVPITFDPWFEGRRNRSLVVPPEQSARYATAATLQGIAGYMSRLFGVDPARVEAAEVHSANLHMHRFGASGRVTLTEPSGRKNILLSVPRWDLNWQRDFTFDEPMVFPAAQLERTRMGVECVFENPTAEEVLGGYGSDDEMCMNLSYVALRLTEPES